MARLQLLPIIIADIRSGAQCSYQSLFMSAGRISTPYQITLYTDKSIRKKSCQRIGNNFSPIGRHTTGAEKINLSDLIDIWNDLRNILHHSFNFFLIDKKRIETFSPET